MMSPEQYPVCNEDLQGDRNDVDKLQAKGADRGGGGSWGLDLLDPPFKLAPPFKDPASAPCCHIPCLHHVISNKAIYHVCTECRKKWHRKKGTGKKLHRKKGHKEKRAQEIMPQSA